MGPQFEKCALEFLRPGVDKNAYIFDAWPGEYQKIEEFVAAFGIRNLFVSSRQSARDLSRTTRSRCTFHWVPEGLDAQPFIEGPTLPKEIDVLQFGRRWDWYHSKIVGPLAEAGYRHLYERSKSQLVFPDRTAFVEGLRRSRVSVCVPSNVTHPARAGDNSTMTQRYLQSMAARTLIVGLLPDDMEEVFGYPPIVPIEKSDPVGQLFEILANYDRYLPLIERNFEAVQQQSWVDRWQTILQRMAVR